jgi:glucose/sorbosone dehydrogenase
MKLCCFLLVVIIVLPSRVVAAALPTGFTEAQVAAGLSNPTAMQFAPEGRLFICEQGGRLRVVKDGALLPAPFLTVTVSSTGERGLLGVAFDPAFAANHFVYVYYTATTPAVHNRISRFTANGEVAVAGSETVILELDNLSSATNHNGGALAFGADGKLYAAVGENANGANAQSMANRSARCCASTRTARFRRTIRFSRRPRAETARSGRSDSAIRSPPRSTPPAHRCSSTTSARTPGRKSTMAGPAPTTAGRRPKGRRPTRASSARGMRTTIQADRARSPAVHSTRP